MIFFNNDSSSFHLASIKKQEINSRNQLIKFIGWLNLAIDRGNNHPRGNTICIFYTISMMKYHYEILKCDCCFEQKFRYEVGIINLRHSIQIERLTINKYRWLMKTVSGSSFFIHTELTSFWLSIRRYINIPYFFIGANESKTFK